MGLNGHNWGLCRKCGKTHIHGMLGHNRDGKICRVCRKIHIHPRGMLGRHHSEETKNEISLTLKGRPLSNETKIKMHLAMNRPEYKELQRNLTNKLWRDPVYREKYTKSRNTSEYKAWENEQLRSIRIKYPTKPQLELYNTIKSLYPDEEVIMEYPFRRIKGTYYRIDVAIPDLMLGFEYDEPYWHQDIEEDERRHKEIESQGWTLIHYLTRGGSLIIKDFP